MDLARVFRSMARRWPILLAGLLLTGAAAYLIVETVPITYDARASILLLPPSLSAADPGNTATDADKNPFLRLDGLEIAAGVLAKTLTDSTTTEALLHDRPNAEYEVFSDPSVPGSVLVISSIDSSEKQAFATLDALVQRADKQLTKMQIEAGAPHDGQITVMQVTNNNKAQPVISGLLRALIVTVAVGVVASALLAVSVDAILRRREARPKKAPAGAEVGEYPAAEVSGGVAGIAALVTLDEA
jgi:hypothetical protein